MFAFLNLLEHDLKKAWNVLFVCKLHITYVLSELLSSDTFPNMTSQSVETSALYEDYIKQGILRNF